jgi:hypothetical protein
MKVEAPVHQATKTSAAKVKVSAVKEPIQQTSPGPKRAAAPQLPVIE